MGLDAVMSCEHPAGFFSLLASRGLVLVLGAEVQRTSRSQEQAFHHGDVLGRDLNRIELIGASIAGPIRRHLF
jgi:hypothetical protein